MKKWLLIILVPIALIVILLLYPKLSLRKSDYFLVESRDLFETLIASGRIEFSEKVEMSFPTPGVIQAISVVEGQKVEKGEQLLGLENASEINQLQLAQNDLELEKINFRKIIEYEQHIAQEEYRRAEIEEEASRDEYQQAQRLFQVGSIPEEELKSAQRKWKIDQSLKNSARKKLENIQENGIGYLEVKKQVERAKLSLIQAEIDLQKRSLFAPFNAMVISLEKTSGEFVQPGETVMVLGKNPFQVVALVDEREYKKLQVGMKAFINEQVHSEGNTFLASVSRISPVVDPTQGTVEVNLLLKEVPPHVKPYATINVEIILREEKGALTFPRSYLTSYGEQTAVWIEKEGKAHLLPLHNVVYVDNWVKTEEISLGTAILASHQLREGQRIILGERRKD